MKIKSVGVLSRSHPSTPRATLTFPTVTVLADGSFLATWRAGSTKDSADETIEFSRSMDGGETWSKAWKPFENPIINGMHGTLKICYLTELTPDHLLAAAMWVDRTTYPGEPLFNEETEGCLPMSILLSDSHDSGESWSPWRMAPMPDEIGPASLTNPIIQLADGSLALSVETNKRYLDIAPWRQKVVFFHSDDQGQTWEGPTVVGEDPTGRIFNWDLRCGVVPDGRVVSFAWTYDSSTTNYLDIHRRISLDHGHTWSAAKAIGIADQAARPVMLPDGRMVLAYVDRFGSQSIRARLAPCIDGPFEPESEVVIYTHDKATTEDGSTGELLAEMSIWTFGLPYAETLPDGDVLVVYYAGMENALDIRWARIAP